MKYNVWNHINFFVRPDTWFWMPDKNKYYIKNLLVLIFHEMAHYIRNYNNKIIFWNYFSFFDANTFEEWLALNNEYFYWNNILNNEYWSYYPF